MSLINKFSFCSFSVQYFLTFVSLLLLKSLNSRLDSILSLVGQLLVLSFISWHLIKTIRKYLYTKRISSYKRAVLITGCDTGFGNETALKLNENGFRVYATVLDPDCDGASNLVNNARFEGKTIVMKMDVTNDDEVKAVYEEIKRDLQRNGEELWAVVNNAGIWAVGPIDCGTTEAFETVFQVNTVGTVRVTRTFLPLIRQSKGRIVNVSSVSGRNTFPNLSIYAMSKSAMISFSDALRRENKKWGIKVSSIEPMAYRTAMTSFSAYQSTVDKIWAQTTEDVKQVYGQQFYENFRTQSVFLSGVLKSGTDFGEVCNKIVDAIRNPDPEISYAMGSVVFDEFLIYLLQFLPTQITDFIFEHMQRKSLIPAQLIN